MTREEEATEERVGEETWKVDRGQTGKLLACLNGKFSYLIKLQEHVAI